MDGIEKLVPKRGLEPLRISPLPPQGSASTNSATWAIDSSLRTTAHVPVRSFSHKQQIWDMRKLVTNLEMHMSMGSYPALATLR